MGGHAQSCAEVFKEFKEVKPIFLGRNMTTHQQGMCFIAIGDNKTRRRIYYENPDRIYMSFLSKNAFGFPFKMGQGTIIMPGAIIREGVTIGDFTIINSGAILEHGVTVGDFCHIAPGAIVCGDGKVSAGAFLGANSTCRQGIKVGTWQFVKAGTVAKEDLPDQDIGPGNQDQLHGN
jgi:acetyltransferase-like isoleucine patch superfamily enzyme